MTDRLTGCTVVFKEPMREDDAEALLEAIALLRNVARVEPMVFENNEAWAQLRVRQECADALMHMAADWMTSK